MRRDGRFSQRWSYIKCTYIRIYITMQDHILNLVDSILKLTVLEYMYVLHNFSLSHFRIVIKINVYFVDQLFT